MSVWSSPAIDLTYLIYTSAASELKIEQFDYLIQFYHTVLVDCLKKLNYSKRLPTLLELQIDVLKRGFYGIILY